ncbi:MAG TPA: esterase [Chitinophagaceae bacterium]|nr:esterase [Chitinophagaceae bacterium]HAN39687.1 esterase [Chitinophagaceae bacterium]
MLFQHYNKYTTNLLPDLLRMKVQLILLVFAIAITGSSCSKSTDNTSNGELPAQTLIDVAYGSDPLQKMDIYLPQGRTTANTKVAVLIHGGAWLAGDKADFNNDIPTLRAQLPDYAFFNINYRLATLQGANRWPTQLNDVNAAYQFLKNKFNEYQVNGDKTIVLGASAGAQLALMQAYQNNSDNKIKVVVDLFGPTDLTDLYNNPPDPQYPNLLQIFMSGTPTSNTANYNSASPIRFVNNQVPPTIIFHGTNDNVVPIRQSDSLHARLQRANVITQYTRYNGEAHGWSGNNLVDTYNKSVAFIKQYNP